MRDQAAILLLLLSLRSSQFDLTYPIVIVWCGVKRNLEREGS